MAIDPPRPLIQLLEWLARSVLSRFFGTLSSDMEGAGIGNAAIDRGLFPVEPEPVPEAARASVPEPLEPPDPGEVDLWEAAG